MIKTMSILTWKLTDFICWSGTEFILKIRAYMKKKKLRFKLSLKGKCEERIIFYSNNI